MVLLYRDGSNKQCKILSNRKYTIICKLLFVLYQSLVVVSMMSFQSGDDGSSSCESINMKMSDSSDLSKISSQHELCLGPEGDVSHYEQDLSVKHITETLTNAGYHILSEGEFLSNSVRTGRGPNGRSVVVKATSNVLELELLQSSSHSYLPHLLGYVTRRDTTLLLIEKSYTTLSHLTNELRAPTALHVDWLRLITHNLSSAIDFLHGRRVAHRAVRSEHVLICRKGAILCGLSQTIQCNQRTISIPTNQNYCQEELLYWAPEMLGKTREYDPFLVDMYAMGVVLYKMMFGRIPYQLSIDHNQIKHFKFNINFSQASTPWKMDETALKLVKLLLSPRPGFRPSAACIKHMEWTRTNAPMRTLCRPKKCDI